MSGAEQLGKRDVHDFVLRTKEGDFWPSLDSKNSPDTSVDYIINSFAEKESENYNARQNIPFQRIMVFNIGTKQQNRTSEIFRNRQGQLEEEVLADHRDTPNVFAEGQIEVEAEDIKSLTRAEGFLTREIIGSYELEYLGEKKIELPEFGKQEDANHRISFYSTKPVSRNTYVFSVEPKANLPEGRYFHGFIWVDQKDLQIVATYLKSPRNRTGISLFPPIQTYRKKIGTNHWFPNLILSDATFVERIPEHGERNHVTVKAHDVEIHLRATVMDEYNSSKK